MQNPTPNATQNTTETTTAGDSLDELMQVIEAHQAVGEVRLSRLAGSTRTPLKQMAADKFDPFTIGLEHGSGRYFAQFAQRGRILKSATFSAEGPATREDRPAHTFTETPRPTQDPMMVEILRGMMQQQTALMTAMTQTTRAAATDTSAEILKIVLPLMLQRDTPTALYKQVFEMAREARHEAAAPARAEPDGMETVLKMLGSIGQILPQPRPTTAAQPQQPVATPPPQLPQTPIYAPPPPAPPVQEPQTATKTDEEIADGLNFRELAALPKILRFGLAEDMDEEWVADTLTARLNKQENAEQLWLMVSLSTPADIVQTFVTNWPEFAEHRGFIERAWAELLTRCTGDGDTAQPDVQMYIPGTEPPPPQEPQKQATTPRKTKEKTK